MFDHKVHNFKSDKSEGILGNPKLAIKLPQILYAVEFYLINAVWYEYQDLYRKVRDTGPYKLAVYSTPCDYMVEPGGDRYIYYHTPSIWLNGMPQSV